MLDTKILENVSLCHSNIEMFLKRFAEIIKIPLTKLGNFKKSVIYKNMPAWLVDDKMTMI